MTDIALNIKMEVRFQVCTMKPSPDEATRQMMVSIKTKGNGF